MMRPHDRFEILAGAIALAEANEAERAEFAAHLCTCDRCRAESGGEGELVRIPTIIANARESETWTPDLSAPVRVRMFAHQRRKVRLAFGALGSAIAASFVLHAALGSGFFVRVQSAFADPPTIKYEGQRIVLERRSARDRHAEQAHHARAAEKVQVAHIAPVVHQTVVLVAAAPSLTSTADQVVAKRASASGPSRESTPIRSKTIEQQPGRAQVGALALSPPALGGTVVEAHPGAPLRPGAGDVPAFAPGKQSAANVVGSGPQDASTAQPGKIAAAQDALAIAPSYVSRDPVPEGGEASIPADYSQLARAENAEGTVGVEVAVDANGNAISCTIVQPSSYIVLDELICKAVKKIHYRPALANGKPVPGTFRFSRTFKLE